MIRRRACSVRCGLVKPIQPEFRVPEALDVGSQLVAIDARELGLMQEQLPHGARGIEVEDLVLIFAESKVVFLSKARQEHYTLHAGPRSGVIDVHRTWTDEEGIERHQTIFAIATVAQGQGLDAILPTRRTRRHQHPGAPRNSARGLHAIPHAGGLTRCLCVRSAPEVLPAPTEFGAALSSQVPTSY